MGVGGVHNGRAQWLAGSQEWPFWRGDLGLQIDNPGSAWRGRAAANVLCSTPAADGVRQFLVPATVVRHRSMRH